MSNVQNPGNQRVNAFNIKEERMETRESQTRESRCVDVTNAGFEIRVKPRIREEHRRGCEFRVVLIQEREDRVK